MFDAHLALHIELLKEFESYSEGGLVGDVGTDGLSHAVTWWQNQAHRSHRVKGLWT